MKVHWLSFALLLGLLVGASAAPAQAQVPIPSYVIAATGSAHDPEGAARAFAGTITIMSFDLRESELVVNGLLEGAVLGSDLTPIGNKRFGPGIEPVEVTLLVTDISGTCTKVHVELASLELSWPDLQIILDSIAIDANAPAGSGGDLCALARRLGGDVSPAGIVDLLNKLVRGRG